MHTLYPPLDTDDPKSDDDMLSPEIRENFDTIRALNTKKKRKSGASDEALEAKRYQVAVKTAVAVEDEMSRLRNGIAELEALLAQQGDDAHQGDAVEAFPSLPPVIPQDDDDDVLVSGLEDSDNVLEEGKKEPAVEGEMVHG